VGPSTGSLPDLLPPGTGLTVDSVPLSALKARVDPRLVVLHGNAKLPEELALAVEHGLGLVVVDGPDDVDRLEATVPAGRAVDVLVRVIPGVTAETHDSVLTGHDDSKFGLAPGRAWRSWR
jgi:diaminopimelate decarboxylase